MLVNKETKTTKKKKRGFFATLLLIIFISSLAACGYLVYGEIQKELGIQDMENDLQSFIKKSEDDIENAPDADEPSDETYTAGPEASMSGNEGYSLDWAGLKKQSKYIIGWIQIPGIERINYPIVQTDDNQFFLTHDWTGAKQSAGAIFMNKYNAPDFSDMNTIIYGHRMKAGSMFGQLKYYESQKFLSDNPYFYVFTPDGSRRVYEIVCCCHVKDGSDAYKLHFETPDERMAYYDMMIYNAVAKRDVKLGKFDTTIMLSTCNTRAGYYERTVVLGKLVSINLNEQEVPE